MEVVFVVGLRRQPSGVLFEGDVRDAQGLRKGDGVGLWRLTTGARMDSARQQKQVAPASINPSAHACTRL